MKTKIGKRLCDELVFFMDNSMTEMIHLIWMPPFHASWKRNFATITLIVNLLSDKNDVEKYENVWNAGE